MAKISKSNPFGRAARFAVVPIETVRLNNVRTDQEFQEAQKGISDEMISALENMVNAAKAGNIEGQAAFAMGAVAW